MRIRPVHVSMAIVVAVMAFVLYATLRTKNPLAVPDEYVPTGELAPGDNGKAGVADIDIVKELDMGTVPNDTPSTRQIEIHNKGTDLLTIKHVQKTCPCLTVVLAKNTIPPRQHTTLDVTIDARKYKGFYYDGFVGVTSTDPFKSTVAFKVKASIEPEFLLEPRELDLGTVTKGEMGEATVVCRQMREKPVEVLGLKPMKGAEALRLSFEPRPEETWQSPGKREYVIRVKVDTRELPTGKYTGYFKILTTCKRVDVYQYKVAAEVDSFYEIEPRTVIWRGDLGTDQEHVETFTIFGETPFDLVKSDISIRGFVVTPRQGPKPNSLCLDIGPGPEARHGRQQGTVNLVLSDGKQTVRDKVRVHALVSNLALLRDATGKKTKSPTPQGTPSQ